MKKNLIALTVAGLFSVNAFAVEPYLQLNAGQSDFDVSGDHTDTVLGAGIGFGVSNNLAFEISYNDFGEASEKDILSIGDKASVEANAVSLAAVGKLPIDSSFQIFGKLGLDIWNTDFSYRDGFVSGSDSDDGTDLFYGVGASFSITESTDIHIEYQAHSFKIAGEDLDVDVVLVGVNFGF